MGIFIYKEKSSFQEELLGQVKASWFHVDINSKNSILKSLPLLLQDTFSYMQVPFMVLFSIFLPLFTLMFYRKLWALFVATVSNMTRMDSIKKIKGKEKIGRKVTEMIEENVPGLQGMSFQNKRIHCGPRIAEEERPTPGYTIMELQTTRDVGTVLKLPVREKRKSNQQNKAMQKGCKPPCLKSTYRPSEI